MRDQYFHCCPCSPNHHLDSTFTLSSYLFGRSSGIEVRMHSLSNLKPSVNSKFAGALTSAFSHE